ncbi:hypothetical protein Rfer_3125 [Rhodoferax ferrireducens T118]|uniref:Uncharacterized protein n=1 Tax=Albidiferax ferrireducens (strain ATCC BAA-621 / DSM 15236 / T118) TaxID=338969 RepID=Q21TR9_ALBFT|nr:hypothetical protein Rfer_3125 [Rhodoferax ferrireducens T118]
MSSTGQGSGRCHRSRPGCLNAHLLCLDVKKHPSTSSARIRRDRDGGRHRPHAWPAIPAKLTLVTNPADLLRQAVATVEADLIGQSPEFAPILCLRKLPFVTTVGNS